MKETKRSDLKCAQSLACNLNAAGRYVEVHHNTTHLLHETEQLGERQKATERHRIERIQVISLHIKRIHPQLYAAFKVPGICTNSASVPASQT